MEKRFAIAMDVGGSHITTAIVDLNEMKVFENSFFKVSFDSNLPSKEVMDYWENAIRALWIKSQVKKLSGIAMAFPGPFDYNDGTCWIKDQDKYNNFYGLNIKDLLRERFDFDLDFPIVFENDAKSFGKGEVYKNIKNLPKNVMAITLGTGLGACFIENGKIVSTGINVPKNGEIWNLPYKNGIAEDSVSLRGLLSNYQNLSGIQLNNGLELYLLAIEGDKKAIEAFHKFGDDLAEIVLPWLKSFNANMFVIGGKIANAGDLFLNIFKEKVKNAGIEMELVISTDNETTALLGAASLLYEA
ncbi:glucokinase [Flavobacterium sp. 90]|uniref:ROK family protein n=1 Tax=unclassified Flavobacterium TaxID=196869 RepID=UPI000EB39BBA|nr:MULTISPECIES: ROK family protein [unclassified Flavobacterium]RKR12059.1 glucokinase [Flavobacterium sp. 81]TCK55831.1 glucokinase [Flavobacterium sp. 90]